MCQKEKKEKKRKQKKKKKEKKRNKMTIESTWAEPYLRTAKDQVGMQVYCNLKWQNHLLVAPCQVQNPDEWFYHMITLTSTNDNTYHSTNHLSTIRNQIYADASV